MEQFAQWLEIQQPDKFNLVRLRVGETVHTLWLDEKDRETLYDILKRLGVDYQIVPKI